MTSVIHFSLHLLLYSFLYFCQCFILFILRQITTKKPPKLAAFVNITRSVTRLTYPRTKARWDSLKEVWYLSFHLTQTGLGHPYSLRARQKPGTQFFIIEILLTFL